MIVENDPMVAEINKQYLSKIDGFRLATIANSVGEAIRLHGKEDIQLIFFDIFMPGNHGLELFSRIKGWDVFY
ncbi:response regulator [Rossellomorea sp. GAMAL-10_SWC]